MRTKPAASEQDAEASHILTCQLVCLEPLTSVQCNAGNAVEDAKYDHSA